VGFSLIGVLISVFISIKYQNIDRNFNKAFARNHRRMWYFNRTIASFRNQKELRAYNARKLMNDAANKENDNGAREYNTFTIKLIILRFFDAFFSLFIFHFLTLAVLAYSFYHKNMTIATLTMLFSAINNL